MGKLKYDAKRRRALNIVWDVSWDYRFDPDFLAYTEQGTPGSVSERGGGLHPEIL